MYQTYALAAPQASERFDAFKGLIDDVFCPMELDADRSIRESFHGRVDVVDLGSVKLVRVATRPIQVRRRAQDIAHIAEPPYLVKFQLKGECFWSQRGNHVHARPGDFVICSTAEPYTLAFRGEYEMPVMVVPGATMRRLTPDPDQFLGRRMAAEDADCGLLSSFVAQVVARMNRLSEPMVHRIQANVLDLLGAVLSARARPGPLSREQLITQVKVFIHDHLCDRNLGPAMIAAAFGISTRSVHVLFEQEPMTVARFIRSLRVAACRRALEAHGRPRASLTDTALTWGFYDLSHMTRCFREEFGEPPRRYLRRPHDA